MFKTVLLFFLTLTTLASAQTPETSELPQMLLGKGMIGYRTGTCEFVESILKEHPDSPNREKLNGYCEREKNTLLFFALECVGRDSNNQLTCAKVQPILINTVTNVVIQRGLVQVVADHDGQPTQKEIKSYLKNLNRKYKTHQSAHLSKGEKIRQDVITIFVTAAFTTGVLVLSAATAGTGGLMILGGLAIGGGSFVLADNLYNWNTGYHHHPEQIDTKSYNWSTDQRKVRDSQFTDFSDFMLNLK